VLVKRALFLLNAALAAKNYKYPWNVRKNASFVSYSVIWLTYRLCTNKLSWQQFSGNWTALHIIDFFLTLNAFVSEIPRGIYKLFWGFLRGRKGGKHSCFYWRRLILFNGFKWVSFFLPSCLRTESTNLRNVVFYNVLLCPDCGQCPMAVQ